MIIIGSKCKKRETLMARYLPMWRMPASPFRMSR